MTKREEYHMTIDRLSGALLVLFGLFVVREMMIPPGLKPLIKKAKDWHKKLTEAERGA